MPTAASRAKTLWTRLTAPPDDRQGPWPVPDAAGKLLQKLAYLFFALAGVTAIDIVLADHDFHAILRLLVSTSLLLLTGEARRRYRRGRTASEDKQQPGEQHDRRLSHYRASAVPDKPDAVNESKRALKSGCGQGEP